MSINKKIAIFFWCPDPSTLVQRIDANLSLSCWAFVVAPLLFLWEGIIMMSLAHFWAHFASVTDIKREKVLSNFIWMDSVLLAT